MRKKRLVISGINIFEGGCLSVFRDCIDTLLRLNLDREYEITAFVHAKKLFLADDRIKWIELPDSRKHYYRRLYYEYIYFHKYSKDKDIEIWISIHDMTPRVFTAHLFTYCHNPSPFLKSSLKCFRYSPANFWFSLFYKYLYRINISKNDAVIVQQDWLRQAFYKMYPVKSIIVARPVTATGGKKRWFNGAERAEGAPFTFIFASLPRFFKNFEVICEACKRLPENLFYQVLLTLDGTENQYSRDIYRRYCAHPCIKWIGLQPRERLLELYRRSDCLIFPSKLETWGLPISEYKETGNPILLADLPYAHETIGTYDKVRFFHPDKPEELAGAMRQVIQKTGAFETCTEVTPDRPYAKNWDELIDILLEISKGK